MRTAVGTTAWLLAGLACAAAPEKRELTWSELTGNRIYRAKVYREQATIKAVGGKESGGVRLVKISPGKHKILVESPYRRSAGNVGREIELNLAPCRRYYINAQFKDAVTSQWEPVVARVELIPGCSTPMRPPGER
jgi:hypothetical protein